MCPYEVTLPYGISCTALYTAEYHIAASSERGILKAVFHMLVYLLTCVKGWAVQGHIVQTFASAEKARCQVT